MKNRDSDFEIIEEVLSGREESFEKIVLKYQERVLRLCSSMVGGSQAEDAAQNIFLKVFESLGNFRARSSFSTWLYRIASNHCLNLIKKKKQEKTDSLDLRLEEYGSSAEPLSKGPSPEASLEGRQTVGFLLAQMSPEEAIILSLREIEGLSYSELTESLGISLDTVKVRLFRARKSFIEASKKFL